jgi:outer membrane protein TolC
MSAIIITTLSAGLTLQEAVKMAIDNNNELQMAKQDVEIARHNYNDVRGQLFPQINLNMNFRHTENHLPLARLQDPFSLLESLPDKDNMTYNEGFIAGSVDRMMVALSPGSRTHENSFATQVQLQQLVFSGGRLINGLRVLGRVRTMQEKRFELAKQNIITTTTNAYFDLFLAQEGLSIQKQALSTAELHNERVRNLWTQGLVSEYDMLRAQLEVARLYPQLLELENMKNLAEENLKRLIGFTGTVILNPSIEEKTSSLIDFEISLETALSQASENRIELYLIDLMAEIFRVQYTVERVNFLPNAILQADITSYNTSNPFSFESNNFGTMGSVGFMLQMPLFTGLSNSAKTLRARHELRRAEYEAINTYELINLEIRQTWQAFNQSKRFLEIHEQNLHLAQRALTIATARFESQVGIQLEVFDAQIQYNAARMAVSQAKIRIIRDYFALARALGKNLYNIIGDI